MARYGQAFKDKAVARLLPPESGDLEVVAREVGVSAGTLERWRADALASGRKSGGWTPAARLEAVIATASISEADKSAWCRAQGLFPSELDEWRQTATASLGSPETAVTSADSRADRRRIRELERNLRRKDKALAEAAALLVLSKKLADLFPKDADE